LSFRQQPIAAAGDPSPAHERAALMDFPVKLMREGASMASRIASPGTDPALALPSL
jgi:hypothetical protein